MKNIEEVGKETENPNILIVTDGITNTKIMIDGKELKGVSGIRFSQSYKENHCLPVLQIDLKATNVTLDAKALPALPEPFKDHYIPVQKVFSSEIITEEQKMKLCRECGIEFYASSGRTADTTLLDHENVANKFMGGLSDDNS